MHVEGTGKSSTSAIGNIKEFNPMNVSSFAFELMPKTLMCNINIHMEKKVKIGSFEILQAIVPSLNLFHS